MLENRSNFTWRPLYAELVKKLTGWSAKEMIDLVNQLGIGEGFRDQHPENKWIEMEDLDPFTFLSMLNKFGSARRIELLDKLCSILNPESTPATDVDGLPTSVAGVVVSL